MPASSPAQQFPYPISTDDPDVPDDMMKLAKAVEKRVMAVYNTTSDRDTKVTAAGGTEQGLFAFIKADNSVWYHNGTAWVKQSWPSVTSGATVPSDATGNDGDVFFKTS